MGTRTSIADSGAAAALFGSTRQAVLGFFFDHPDERFYQRQVVRSLALGSGAVQRELARLVVGGILTRTVEGRQAYYQVNQNGSIYPELHGLVRKTMGAVGVLREALRPLTGHIRVAFIFGSMARHSEQAESDIDVMVIGDAIGLSGISPVLRPAQNALRREVNPMIYRTAEFSKKLADGHHFLTRVMEGAKVFLIGGEHELSELGAVRLAKTAPLKQAGNR
ncbi:MAG: nucleotidyltransferase domain-containing protein [Planctomycetota bacterium]|nr:nucleotidyltransferase domain-containing protein [Planctomycetota bacterium]